MLIATCVVTVASAQEKFMRSDRATGAAVELRSESTIIGNEIRFRQIVRFADADKDIFDPIGDLVVARFGSKQSVRSISVAELRQLLRDAGVNTVLMNFTGSLTCTITRSDVAVTQDQKLEQLIAEKTAPKPLISEPVVEEQVGTRSLRAVLEADLASRLGIPIESLQLTFKGEDEKILRLSEPQVRFGIQPQRVGNLGDVSWHVTLTTDAGGSTKAFVAARAQAWQDQLVVVRPLATKQIITETDVAERRTLVDQLDADPLLKRPQTVGQQASRPLKPGTVMTGKMVDAVQLVRPGQFVTIEHATGAVRVKIVARAIDGGTFGQSIRVKNETTREIMRVTVTGPQEASINPPDLSDDASKVALQ